MAVDLRRLRYFIAVAVKELSLNEAQQDSNRGQARARGLRGNEMKKAGTISLRVRASSNRYDSLRESLTLRVGWSPADMHIIPKER